MQIINSNNIMARFRAAAAWVVTACLLVVAPLSLAATSQPTTRDFNHMSTGFPLTGAHATADCATCHVGGVFKGTPKNCAGCHTIGSRVVAMPKSQHHIVTNDPCEICHTNTVTFLGVKFNHASVTPGTCANCHNGVSQTGRPASHNSGNKLTQSCDQCHRTIAWLPASFNHNGITADCGTCHVPGGQASAVVPTSPIHTILPTLAQFGASLNMCSSCHRNYVSFSVHSYNHSGVTSSCQNCHNATYASYGISTIVIPTNHIPISGTSCSDCHTNPSNMAIETMNHNSTSLALPVQPCKTCHLSGGSGYLLGSKIIQKNYGHEGFKTSQDCISCHRRSYSSWGG